MQIKELYKQSLEHELIDLQALILFLTIEKQVISMDDNVHKLDLYFQKQHSERMNKELSEYKQKLNMRYNKNLYIVKTNEGHTLTRAVSETDAIFQKGGQSAELVIDEFLYIGNKKYETKKLLEESK